MENAESMPSVRAAWPKRVLLGGLMIFIAVNIWTGGPLAALWIGSRVQSGSGGSLTIRPISAIAVFASLAAITFVLVKLLSVVSGAYDRASGITRDTRRTRATWLGADRPKGGTTTMLERTLIAMVVIAGLAFEIWFFFYSTSPIDNRSGRSQAPTSFPSV
jgi:hypothetical protein